MSGDGVGPHWIGTVFRNEAARAHAAVLASFRDIELAEDAVQDAFAEAMRTWSVGAVPDNPGAWITTVAQRRAIDRWRRDRRRFDVERPDNVGPSDGFAATADLETRFHDEPAELGDEQLRLLFVCCHPALSVDAQVSLTLRLVCGLSVQEIAALLLCSEPTVGQRISRAKAKIRQASIPLELPPTHQLPERLSVVLSCIYLVFTEGYRSVGDSLMREELCAEAIRLGVLATTLIPDDPEPRGLLALMMLQHSHRDARLVRGKLQTLATQDRTRWRHDEIERAHDELATAARHRRVGPYQLQAIIAATHAQAMRFEHTDWSTIDRCYHQLTRAHGSPTFALQRAVALGHLGRFADAFSLVDQCGAAPNYANRHEPFAVRGYLLDLVGDGPGARSAYRIAVDRAIGSASSFELAHLRRCVDAAPVTR